MTLVINPQNFICWSPTLGCAHERVHHRRKPARVEAILYRYLRNLCIGKTLGDKHQSHRKPSDHIVDEPSIVVLREPTDDGQFVDEIVSRRCWQSPGSLGSELARPVPGVVIPLIADEFLGGVHDENDLLNNQDRRSTLLSRLAGEVSKDGRMKAFKCFDCGKVGYFANGLDRALSKVHAS